MSHSERNRDFGSGLPRPALKNLWWGAMVRLLWAGQAHAQAEWVKIKEPPSQCWQDLQLVASGVFEFDQASRVARIARVASMGGDISFVAQVLSEYQWDPKKKKPNPQVCILVVKTVVNGIDAGPTAPPRRLVSPEITGGPTYRLAAPDTNPQWQAAHMLKAKIETLMKQRRKNKE
jgi:hypothetical protein